MDYLEQENRVLREEMTVMQTRMDEMAELIKTMVETQTQAQAQIQAQAQALAQAQTQAQAVTEAQARSQAPPPPPPIRTQAEASSSWTLCADTPTQSAPQRSAPWFPPFTAGEIFRPITCEAQMPTHQYTAQVPLPAMRATPATMTYSVPVMHTIPQAEEPIFHSGNAEAYGEVSDLREKYDELRRDMKALHEKGKFGKTAYDLCLVPSVQVPHKIQDPRFREIQREFLS
ncbi:hypothetical protein MTR_0595s0020 [Medicago truncatula]|uniref:Uncharacterized protein n=1 Tax=Medicago truncatula TaxID=3880 RepID=A0A072TDW9_MEDTR|nr:hypothetical protein MTR_0595s0020 [Medicago truncatula]